MGTLLLGLWVSQQEYLTYKSIFLNLYSLTSPGSLLELLTLVKMLKVFLQSHSCVSFRISLYPFNTQNLFAILSVQTASSISIQKHVGIWPRGLIKLHQPAHCTEARFASFLSSGYINVIVVNPPEKKLAKCSSVHCAIAMQAYQTQGRIKLPGILITKYHKVVSINPAGLVTLLVYKHTQIDTFCPDQC